MSLTSQKFKDEKRTEKEKAKIIMMYLFAGSITLIFSGLTSAAIVRKSSSFWFAFEIPKPFITSTILILASSLTLYGGYLFTKKANRWLATLLIFITLVLGIGFCILQWEGWKDLVHNDIWFNDNKTGNMSGSFFYVLTAVHLLHVLGGIVALIFVCIKSAMGKYINNLLGLKLISIYWHFLMLLWVYLYFFLSFIVSK